MNSIMSGALAATLSMMMLPALAQDEAKEASPVQVETETEKLSYAVGVQMGNGIRDLPDLDLDVVKAAMEDVLAERELAISQEEMQQLLMAMSQELQQKQQQRMQEEQAAAEAEAAGREESNAAWLEENAAKEGVQVTDSGLQYEVLEEGSGDSPAATDQVTVHYRGTLLDGTVFDSSYDRGEPATFPLNQVIPGWTEGLQLMKEGAKYKLYIPAELGYGSTYNPNSPIPPNSILTFEVELLEVGDSAPQQEEGVVIE